MRIAIIGGTGLYDCIQLVDERRVNVKTPFGDAFMKQGRMGDVEVIFMQRHGEGHSIPPHKVNYRANIWALWWLGVERIIGTAASGSLNPSMEPGDLVAVDQFLDFTKTRPSTFFEGGEVGVVHTDVTEPYCPEIRKAIIQASGETGSRIHSAGCYVCTEGPRFETAAEIKAFSILGGDLVGMTNVPEVVLAREAGICYGLIGIVTNFAAGISRGPLSHEEVLDAMKTASQRIASVIRSAVQAVPEKRRCTCGTNWGRLAGALHR